MSRVGVRTPMQASTDRVLTCTRQVALSRRDRVDRKSQVTAADFSAPGGDISPATDDCDSVSQQLDFMRGSTGLPMTLYDV